jgi:hypothetical protein
MTLGFLNSRTLNLYPLSVGPAVQQNDDQSVLRTRFHIADAQRTGIDLPNWPNSRRLIPATVVPSRRRRRMLIWSDMVILLVKVRG